MLASMSTRLKSALLSLCLSILGIGAPVVFAQQDLAQQQDQTADVLYSNLHKNIQDLFNEYGVQIMTPAYRDDKEVSVVVPKETGMPRRRTASQKGNKRSKQERKQMRSCPLRAPRPLLAV